MPNALPNKESASVLVSPAATRRSGRMMETSEVMTEFAVRIAVMGSTEPKSGTSSFLGLANRPPLKKNTAMPAAKENT